LFRKRFDDSAGDDRPFQELGTSQDSEGDGKDGAGRREQLSTAAIAGEARGRVDERALFSRGDDRLQASFELS
jgi:hypothetical protein